MDVPKIKDLYNFREKKTISLLTALMAMYSK